MIHTKKSNLSVVIVDDEPTVLFGASALLQSVGIKPVETLEDSRALLPLLETREVDCVILDLFMPYLSGLQILPLLARHYPELPVIVLTAAHELDTAVACMKEGAFDYLAKPVDDQRFITTVEKALEVSRLRRQVGVLKNYLLSDRLIHGEAFASIITKSRKMRAIFQYMESIAGSCEPILICGETGVGKELIANTLHTLSGRKGALIALNVAGLDDTMFSDTLFGHRKGAFSGAEENRLGLITQAAGGTLFLDEIGDLGHISQVKLLRLLQENKYYPLGSDVPRNSDTCFLCATNRHLPKLMDQERFRSDLYFRLSVHQIEIPPLRDRREDIPYLVHYFVEEAATALGKKVPNIPAELLQLLEHYPFPGNIRQLRSMIYDAVARSNSPTLSTSLFNKVIPSGSHTPPSPRTEYTEPSAIEPIWQRSSFFPTLKENEEKLIQEALRRTNGNQGMAATLLGISRQALNQRLRKKTPTPS
ncbi:MAG: sigma-54 dependent transcriptional regulator [Magnetococcus sp. DMHC-6]